MCAPYPYPDHEYRSGPFPPTLPYLPQLTRYRHDKVVMRHGRGDRKYGSQGPITIVYSGSNPVCHALHVSCCDASSERPRYQWRSRFGTRGPFLASSVVSLSAVTVGTSLSVRTETERQVGGQPGIRSYCQTQSPSCALWRCGGLPAGSRRGRLRETHGDYPGAGRPQDAVHASMGQCTLLPVLA